MKLTIHVDAPATFLAAIKKEMDEHVDTWEYNAKGDFTHTRPQYDKKGFLRPNSLVAGELSFTAVWPANTSEKDKDEIRPIMFGRFAEMLLSHSNALKFTDILLVP